ncbi:cellulose biosynthesis protein BcsO [Erwinia piriflorinigrans]|uniref:Cellulose biosynthesis protein BcsO n=1 Tax=Erwinia piriflorinigrans CFBP 5888 TaxID=1161919 RepID=V5ZDF2_9GAMM|nr:cellulose biosynthesis protein BcsO [Erwinia piriflorinigrans]CCG89064.1 hypothetical protein EPIR_3701 [Erwinia piriflorinigrans CFBP 5888]
MKSYDDLHRFKEKIKAKNIDFKDMSEQLFHANDTRWVVIKQLMNENADSEWHIGQRIGVPQAVGPDAFMAPKRDKKTAMAGSNSPTAAKITGASLLDSIAVSMPPPETTSAVARTETLPPVAQKATVSNLTLLKQLESVPLSHPVSAMPAAATGAEMPATQIKPAYRQLFRSPAASASDAMAKETLLKPLLEKIALCR